MNIIILNLPKVTIAEDLVVLFQPYGKVESTNIVIDEKTKKSKGFGFVEMLDEDEANTAIKKLHEQKFGGKKIRVKKSNKVK